MVHSFFRFTHRALFSLGALLSPLVSSASDLPDDEYLYLGPVTQTDKVRPAALTNPESHSARCESGHALRPLTSPQPKPIKSKSPVPPCFTGRVIEPTEIHAFAPGVIAADCHYAEVNSKWLKSFYSSFRTDLFDREVVHWDERFDCNRFSALYRSLSQVTFFNDSFHSDTVATALAIGEVWYRPAWANGTLHAINVAITEIGPLYIDPQSGETVILTESEKFSITLRIF